MLRKILGTYLKFISIIIIKRYRPIIICITGNTGKTTTKEAIFCVLNMSFLGKVRKTEDNLNTDIGVPISILALNNAKGSIIGWTKNIIKTFKIFLFGDKNFPKYIVLELAADKPGEIEYFVKFLPINIGVITTIGKNPVHLANFSSKKELIREKEWLVKGVIDGGVLILNRDDKDVFAMKKSVKNGIKVLSYGKNINSNFLVTEHKILCAKNRKFYTKIKFKFQNRVYNLKLMDSISSNSFYSVMPALLLGHLLRISLEDGIRALEKNRFLPLGRMNIIKGIKNTTIIDDTYNASPLSYLNALTSIDSININEGKKILIMGDMAELGEDSLNIHKEILNNALNFADNIICIGKEMILAFKAITSYNKDSKRLSKINIANDYQEIIHIAKKIIENKDLILIKGAQVMRMERVVKALMKSPKQAKKLLVRQEKHWLNYKS